MQCPIYQLGEGAFLILCFSTIGLVIGPPLFVANLSGGERTNQLAIRDRNDSVYEQDRFVEPERVSEKKRRASPFLLIN